MSRTIASQLQYAVLQSQATGTSKYDDRAQKRSHDRTYSHKSMKSRLEVARNLGKFIQANYPECRMARDIRPEMVNKWLDNKVNSGCRQASLERFASEARFIERACERAFPTYEGFSPKEIRTPAEDKHAIRNSNRGAHGMTQRDLHMLKDAFKPTSNNYKAVVIQETTGARSEGVTHLKGSDIHLDGNRCTVDIRGEKGGRDRTVEVVKPEHVQALRELKASAKDGYVCQHRGQPLKPESIQKAYQRALSKLDTDRNYKGATSHSIRKMWAQNRYNEYRQDHGKHETIEYINEQLGHSGDRDVALLERYVADLW